MVNGDESKQSNINRTFPILIGHFQERTNKLNSGKLEKWKLVQKSNEKENEKTRAGC